MPAVPMNCPRCDSPNPAGAVSCSACSQDLSQSDMTMASGAGMPDVVRECQRLYKVGVQLQRARHRAADLRHL